MLRRLITGIVIVALTVGFLALRFVSPYFFDVYIAVMAVFATLEVCNAFEKNSKRNDKYFIITYPLAILLTLVISLRYNLGEIEYFCIIALETFVYILTMFIKNVIAKKQINREILDAQYKGSVKNYVAKKTVLNLFLLFYPAFILSLMFYLNHMADFALYGADGNVSTGMIFLLMILVTTMFTDTGAYLIGSGFGGKKLCPNISPKKTISGAIGGFFSGVLGSILLFCVLNFIPSCAEVFATNNWSLWHYIGYGAIASIVVQFGDIYASWIKRQNGIKDFGNAFPGHGGFMDRVDGIAFNLIFTTILSFFMFM